MALTPAAADGMVGAPGGRGTMPSKNDCVVESLGERKTASPLLERLDEKGEAGVRFRDGSQRVLADDRADRLLKEGLPVEEAPAFELAGPRRKLFFDPGRTTIGVVTCGGLCPGLNNVIRDIVMSARYHYGVQRIVGFQYGYRGLVTEGLQMELTPDLVSEIHERGGTILGASRGAQTAEAMVDGLVRHGINVLFVIGGDGTMRGALEICDEIRRRELPIGVIGVPKTIDNDFKWMDQSFGFVTAASKAVEALNGAHREAQGAPNGIGVVKVMGRHSGFIACVAALASNHANFVLIPEVPFDLDGRRGFLEALRARMARKRHALIVVAEGAGQRHLEGGSGGFDASGNVKLGDVGPFLCERIKRYFGEQGTEVNVKYIDPSYLIRSVRAMPTDSVLCTDLALNGVHAAMAGKTRMVVAVWRRHTVHIPIEVAISERHSVDPLGPLWLNVLGATGQPAMLR